jgi:hypothetical protein
LESDREAFSETSVIPQIDPLPFSVNLAAIAEWSRSASVLMFAVKADSRADLKTDSGCELHTAGVTYSGGLSEGGVRVGGIGSRSPGCIGNHVVAVIERIKGFGDALKFHALGQCERAAETGVQTEEVEADACVAPDHGAGERFGAGIQACVGGQAESGSAWPLRCCPL